MAKRRTCGTNENIQAVKVGDYVWLSNGHSDNQKYLLEIVSKITGTQIVLDQPCDRYYRTDGRKVGAFMFCSKITFIATPAKVQAWQEKERRAEFLRRVREADKAAIEIIRQALNSALPKNAHVGYNSDDSSWAVTITGLTDRKVRELAAKL